MTSQRRSHSGRGQDRRASPGRYPVCGEPEPRLRVPYGPGRAALSHPPDPGGGAFAKNAILPLPQQLSGQPGTDQEVTGREVLLFDGSRLPIGRRYTEQFQGKFISYLNLNSC